MTSHMKTIAVVNNKGGTGKTETVIWLAHIAHHAGIDVISIDLDPQANLTQRTLYAAKNSTPAIDAVLGGAAPPTAKFHEAVTFSTSGYLVTATPNLANVEQALAARTLGGATALRNVLRQHPNLADLCLIDCPPNFGALTVNALLAADHILIPSEAEKSSIAGVERTIDVVGQCALNFDRAPAISGILATRVCERVLAHQAGISELRNLATMHQIPFLGAIPRYNGIDATERRRQAYRQPMRDLLSNLGFVLDEDAELGDDQGEFETAGLPDDADLPSADLWSVDLRSTGPRSAHKHTAR